MADGGFIRWCALCIYYSFPPALQIGMGERAQEYIDWLDSLPVTDDPVLSVAERVKQYTD